MFPRSDIASFSRLPHLSCCQFVTLPDQQLDLAMIRIRNSLCHLTLTEKLAWKHLHSLHLTPHFCKAAAPTVYHHSSSVTGLFQKRTRLSSLQLANTAMRGPPPIDKSCGDQVSPVIRRSWAWRLSSTSPAGTQHHKEDLGTSKTMADIVSLVLWNPKA